MILVSKAFTITKEGDEDEDPLRSQSELKTYSVKPDYYKFWYIALGNTDDNPKMVKARQEAWLHHCQWLRRSSLVPDIPVRLFLTLKNHIIRWILSN